MEYTLKKYKGFTYIEYFDEKSGERFTNANYFVFELNDTFKEIMHNVGGFVAEMTTRMVKEFNLPCKKIMLCQSPCKNNTFLFQFVYLSSNNTILNVEWDNNYFDYEYFHKKFADCIVEEGWVFDLLQRDYLKEVTKEFKIPTVHFDISVNGREISTKDILICKDLCFLKNEYIKKFREYGVSYAELEYNFNCFKPNHFVVKFVKKDGSLLLNYSAIRECKTFQEFQEKYPDFDNDFYQEPFEDMVSISIIRQLANHFELKIK